MPVSDRSNRLRRIWRPVVLDLRIRRRNNSSWVDVDSDADENDTRCFLAIG